MCGADGIEVCGIVSGHVVEGSCRLRGEGDRERVERGKREGRREKWEVRDGREERKIQDLCYSTYSLPLRRRRRTGLARPAEKVAAGLLNGGICSPF